MVIVCNIWGKGMLKIVPILMGVLVSYLLAAVTGNVDFSGVKEAAWIGLPVQMQNTVFGLLGSGKVNTGLLVSSIIMIVPIAFATMMEHVGDISAIRRRRHRDRRALRRARQHHLRREHRRPRADQGL